MPSLIPKLAATVPALDLREVFLSEATKPTVERVIKYIGHIFDSASNRSETERNHPFVVCEEFDLFMPTQRAYFDELAVCEAILKHSSGVMSDLDIKQILDAYIESHIYVYKNGVRTVKAGDFDDWARVDLVYITHAEKNIAFTCNEVQAWFVYFLIPEGGLKMVRL